jgi:hypothetical protein
MGRRMIQTVEDAKGWLEARGGTWTKVRKAGGWEVIAWVGPFSRRHSAQDGEIDDALVETVGQLVRDPVLAVS